MPVEVADVRRALEKGEFEPFFQPLVQLRTGDLAGFEVLARWKHPELGLILPDDFISLVEQIGRIHQLTEHVATKALLFGSSLPERFTLAINVTPHQLQDLSLPDLVKRITDHTGFSAQRLVMEITESALFENLGRAQSIAEDLKALGCRLALDDFGTGYSSLAHLQALPFDQLKIDRSFVQSMARTRESRKIVAAIVGLGHSLGMATVAEGIETEAQADMLLWLGCELGQGWLYSKAIPQDEVAELVAAGPRPVAGVPLTPGDGWAVSSLEALPTHRLAQLQAIYDGAPVGLCFVDRNLRYVSINRRLAEMNGASIAAHIGKTIKEVIPKSYPVLEPYLLRALAGEAIAEVEVSRPANEPGGDNWTAMLSYQPALDEADEVIGLSIAVAEISGHKGIEDALSTGDNLQQNQGTEGGAPWIMDAQGNSLHVSSHWVQNVDRNKSRRNLGWLEALHPDDLETTLKSMRGSLRTGEPIDIRYRVKNLDGEWTWMRSKGSPRFGSLGEIVRWYGSVELSDPPSSVDEHPARPLLRAVAPKHRKVLKVSDAPRSKR